MFIPEPLLVHDPVQRVIVRRKDIVQMQYRAGTKLRVDPRKFVFDVTAELVNVAGVHEQEGAVFQQCLAIHRLQLLSDQPHLQAFGHMLCY